MPPWTAIGRHEWIVVSIKNFPREMIGYFTPSAYETPLSVSSVSWRVPDREEMARLSGHKIQVIDVSLEKRPDHLKLLLPPSEEQKIQRHRFDFVKRVMK
jgi:hypothetical protein